MPGRPVVRSSRRKVDALPQPSAHAIDRPSRRSARTRGTLVAAARSLLEEKGVAGLTVNAVTDRAEVAHGTFYHHFASTEAVLAAGIEASMRELAEQMAGDYADADDTAWVFVASMSRAFRMLTRHPAIGWMLERPHALAAAIREVFGPFARRDLVAMIEAGDVAADTVAHAARWWEWMILGALTDAVARPRDARTAEKELLETVLRVVGVDGERTAALLGHLADGSAAPKKRNRV